METLITVVHYILCIVLIISILLQAGKGADIGAAFGAGTSQALFGPRGAATFLNKLTAILSVFFFLTSLGLASYSRNRQNQSSVFERIPITEGETLPTVPETK